MDLRKNQKEKKSNSSQAKVKYFGLLSGMKKKTLTQQTPQGETKRFWEKEYLFRFKAVFVSLEKKHVLDYFPFSLIVSVPKFFFFFSFFLMESKLLLNYLILIKKPSSFLKLICKKLYLSFCRIGNI